MYYYVSYKECDRRDLPTNFENKTKIFSNKIIIYFTFDRPVDLLYTPTDIFYKEVPLQTENIFC